MKVIKLRNKTNVVVDMKDNSNPKDIEKLSTHLGEASRLCQSKIVATLRSLQDKAVEYDFVETELPVMLWQVRMIIQVMAKCHPRSRLQCLSDISSIAKLMAMLNTLGVDEDRIGKHAISKYSLPTKWMEFCVAPTEIKWADSNKLSDLRMREEPLSTVSIADPSTVDEIVEHLRSAVEGNLSAKAIDDDVRKTLTIGDLSGYVSCDDGVVRFADNKVENYRIWKIDLPSKGLARKVIMDDYLDAFFALKVNFCE